MALICELRIKLAHWSLMCIIANSKCIQWWFTFFPLADCATTLNWRSRWCSWTGCAASSSSARTRTPGSDRTASSSHASPQSERSVSAVFLATSVWLRMETGSFHTAQLWRHGQAYRQTNAIVSMLFQIQGRALSMSAGFSEFFHPLSICLHFTQPISTIDFW